MSIVLASLDDTVVDRSVLEAALRLGEMTGSGVEALRARHRRHGPKEMPEVAAVRSKVLFRMVKGSAEPALLGALDEPEVVAAVVGVPVPATGRPPVGRARRRLLAHAHKPVMVVPSGWSRSGRFRRLLVPLEGTEGTSRPVIERMFPLLAADVELVVLHVFTDRSAPAMLDQPKYDLEILGKEFLLRHCPPATRIVLQRGAVAARVAELSEACEADLVVLSWTQTSSPGRARVVSEVLRASAVPVLLLPSAAESSP